MLNFEITKNGNLSISLDQNDDLEDFNEAEGYCERRDIIAENFGVSVGEYCYTTADQIGAMSEADCFLTEMSIEDDGAQDAVGDWFYYNDYMINDFTELLKNGETVIFTKYRA